MIYLSKLHLPKYYIADAVSAVRK